MELRFLPTLAFPLLLHDALSVVGVAISLLIGLVFINFGLLLSGLFTWLDGSRGGSPNEYVECGPVAAPLIADPAPGGMVSRETKPDPEPVVQPHIWRTLLGHMPTPLTSSVQTVKP